MLISVSHNFKGFSLDMTKLPLVAIEYMLYVTRFANAPNEFEVSYHKSMFCVRARARAFVMSAHKLM